MERGLWARESVVCGKRASGSSKGLRRGGLGIYPTDELLGLLRAI